MKFGILGGDLRIVKLAECLEKNGHTICTYGLENAIFKSNKMQKCGTIEEMRDNSEIIISSIPLSKDGTFINTSFSKENINIVETFNKLKKKCFIAGAMNSEILELAKKNNIEVIDILQEEKLSILNSIPTAEGAIQIAMEESEITIHESNCLVLGFGRIGKVLSKMLQGIGAKTYVEARKEEDLSWIKSYGYIPISLDNLEKNLSDYDFIFNTIPHLIIDKEKIRKLKKSCIIIDLASKPGGVDFESAKARGIKTIWALGLPGKVAPETSAKYIQDILTKIVNKRR